MPHIRPLANRLFRIDFVKFYFSPRTALVTDIEKVGLVLFKLRKAYTNLVLQGTDHVISLTTISNSKN